MSGSPESIAWGRVLSLLRPLKAGLAAMVGLSVLGSLAGLVPPITLGYLINDLVELHGVKPEDALWAGLLAGSIIVEAAAYIGSDGLYARNSGRLYRNLRLLMFDGVMRRPAAARADTEGLPSRFISDAETFERVTIYVLDSGSMLVVELGTALVALGLLEPWAIPVVAPLLAATWFVTRRMQEPAASAGQERQEQLEELTGTLARELSGSGGPPARSRFLTVAERLLRAEVHLGWVQAANLHLSGGLAKLGPIAVVVAAASAGSYRAGTLLTLYLLAARAFYGFDGLVDLSLGMQSVRGAIARCLELIEPSQPDSSNASATGLAA
jgi:ABC-type multidrug transport system fused ATPase/permease subunit